MKTGILLQENINECEMVIAAAKRANKGRYVHKINSCLGEFEDRVFTAKRFGLEISQGEFERMCQLKQKISSMLWLNNNIK